VGEQGIRGVGVLTENDQQELKLFREFMSDKNSMSTVDFWTKWKDYAGLSDLDLDRIVENENE